MTLAHRLHGALVAIVLIAAPMRSAQAQLPIPSVSIMGGVASYDLSGTGTAPVGALRVSIPLLFVIGEGSLGVMRTHEDVGTRTYLIPEAQLQWQLFPLLVRPYIGIGGGVMHLVSGPGSQSSTFTGSASVGVRAGVPLIGAGLRAEARLRGIGTSFGGSSVEYLLGVSF